MRRWLSAGLLAVVVAAALLALGGGAPAARAAAPKCPNLVVTKPGVTPQGVPATYAVTLRFVLQGAGCQESRRAIQVYFTDIAKGECATHGTACLLRIPGWSCGLGFAGLGPQLAGCDRIGLPHRGFEVFKVGRSKLVKTPIPPGIFFWGSVAAQISGPGLVPLPPVKRPSRIFLTNDGADVLIGLHWSSWGGSVAIAQGTNSASNGVPNIAQGKRTNVPATVTLSNPGVFQGHRVYRCFAQTIPSQNFSSKSCLQQENGRWFFLSAPTTPG